MSYLDELRRELARTRLPRRIRRRIGLEIEDHLACDPKADLGSPAALARQFADELGTSLARRAAFASFAALAVAGVAFALAFVAQADRGLARAVGQSAMPAARAGIWLMVLGSQIAFVSGALAALRALRRRRDATMPQAEAAIVLRRCAIGLGSGLITMGGLALTALTWHGGEGSWKTLALVGAASGILAIVAALPVVVAAGRLRPAGPGDPGGLSEDVGGLLPASLHGRPWRFALAVALAVGIAVAGAGLLQADPFDGALRGLAEGAACLTGFGLLGRYLALRP